MPAPLKQALWQIPALLILSFTAAVTVNHFRSDPLHLIGDWSVDARFADSKGSSMVITLQESAELFNLQQALFIDARPKDQYDKGHIKNAHSLPQQEVETYFMEIVPMLDAVGNKTIITYCDGETCELSHELAIFLKDMGFNNVRVLVNGWSVWNEAGLPVTIEG